MSSQDLLNNPTTPEAQLQWCYTYLVKTSRSFAVVIQALGDELRDAVCLFYLTLRALDTVEDDTRFPKERRIPLLISFHKKLFEKGWNFNECGEGDEKTLLANFNIVIDVFLRQKPVFQEVIAEITRRMGDGMSEFVQREVDSLDDWDLYCHYVAGLVGIGLSKLFAASGLEDESYRYADRMSNSMGLALQKTNIIRDYLEDINQDRIFWPKAVWNKYAAKLEDFKDPKNSIAALNCLNELITNAMQHIPDCLQYMDELKDPNVFNFCAIPQIMSISTLALCYNNHDVFTSVVKMKREDTEKIIASMMYGKKALFYWYYYFINIMISKVPFNDPNRKIMIDRLQSARADLERRAGGQPIAALASKL